MQRYALCVALVVSAAAAHAQAIPRCGTPGHSVRFFDTLPVDGVQRTALVNVPPHARAAPLPLIFAFHGASATGPFKPGHYRCWGHNFNYV